MKKTSVLSSLLLPQGFVKKQSVFLRNYLNESVQIVQLVPDSFSRSNVTISVFSIYQEKVRTWINSPKFFPANYQVIAFESHCKKCVLGATENRFEIRHQGFYPLSDSEEIECLKTSVIPILNHISSQDQLLSLQRSLDDITFGCNYLLNENLIYPALATKRYEIVSRIIDAILQQHRDAEERMKNHLNSSEFAAYCSSALMKRQSIIQIKKWIEGGETPLIEQFLERARINNLSALEENGIISTG